MTNIFYNANDDARHSFLTLSLTIISCALWIGGTTCRAQETPYISPTATFITSEGEEESLSYKGSAPLTARFKANAEDVGAWMPHYEWRFYLEGDEQPYLIRYEEDTEYTFTEAGSHHIMLYATFTLAGDTVYYTDEYWSDNTPITVTIYESKLDFPNAFSPNNGDDLNNIFKAKRGYQSIVEFHAYIFNRWGQLLYDWTDPAGGWDGTYKGNDVKEGVYFLMVKAKGADGRVFNIKKDVNLLRGYIESERSSQ